MSDTPPDRKEEAGAPDGPRNPWVRWLAWAILVPVLYVLSFGPVASLVNKSVLPHAVLNIYGPLRYLPDDIWHLVERYNGLWFPQP